LGRLKKQSKKSLVPERQNGVALFVLREILSARPAIHLLQLMTFSMSVHANAAERLFAAGHLHVHRLYPLGQLFFHPTRTNSDPFNIATDIHL
jgi:hypothetical protein